ncbi:MAG: tetratricopeptide repeat protein [Spirochaetota bacterium]
MLVPLLLTGIFLLSAVTYYFFYLAPKLDPKNRAEQFLMTDRYDDAIVEYKKILEHRPHDPVALYRLANVYIKVGENDKAVESLETIVEAGNYSYEVDQLDVKRKLGKLYYLRDEIEKTFDIFFNLLSSYPGDADSMYHVAFIALGQEEYGFAQRYFDRLCKSNDVDYETFFGAGMCAYQNQKINECVDYFKKALDKKNDSKIVILAMAFSLWRKREYSKALGFASKLVAISDEIEVRYIALRLEAILNVHLKKYDTAVKKLEEVLDLCRQHDMDDEELLTLYDLGFICVKADRIQQAETYWSTLSKTKRSYRNIQNLLMTLQREMERKDAFEFQDSIHDYVDTWLEHFFPENFLWNICGLKSEYFFDIKGKITTVKQKGEARDQKGYDQKAAPDVDNIETFLKLDTENFRITANRLVQKFGYRVDEILPTYKEPDGVDFMAVHRETNDKTYVWVRRWKGMSVGEIPMRNFAQMVNEFKARKGLFITTVGLTEGAERSLDQLSKVTVIRPEEVNDKLRGLI